MEFVQAGMTTWEIIGLIVLVGVLLVWAGTQP